ncbi:MAG: hypothetical protein V1779_05240 [bacterium]
MRITLTKDWKFINTQTILLDIIFITAIYFIPSFSHLLSFPVYLIEPMRIILILAIVHTNKTNAYMLAFTLPLVSFLFSGHPVFPKFSIVMLELIMNVWLYFFILNIISGKKSNQVLNISHVNLFISVFLSIIISKSLYYLLKFALINMLLLDSGLISTPVYIQIIVTFCLSAYICIIFRTKKVLN